MFFIGPAAELNEQGKLANAWLREFQPLLVERYFIHPPFYFVFTAYWIRMFGLSSLSLTAMQSVWYWAASIALGWLLLQSGFKAWFLAPILLAATYMDRGLRPDMMGLALLFSGAILARTSNGFLRMLGLVLLLASVGTYMPLLSYALPLTVTAGIRHRPRSWILAAIGAGMLVCFFFLLSIDFRVKDFWTDLMWHHGLRGTPLAGTGESLRMQFTNGYAEMLYLPVFVFLAGITLVAVWNKRTLPEKAKGLVLIVIAGLAANILLYVIAVSQLGGLAGWIAVAMVVPEFKVSLTARSIIMATACALFLMAQSYSLVRLVGSKSETEAHYEQIRNSIPTSGRLFVDDVAARFVFDYRLPRAAIAWNFSKPTPPFWPKTTAERSPNEVWVIATAKAASCQGLPEFPRIKFMGRSFNSLPAHPNRVMLFPETSRAQ